MRNSFNVQYVNIKFSNNATDLHQAFAFLGNCISFNTGSNFKPHVADIDISDIVTAVDAMYAGCTQISDFYINGTGVTTMVETFYQCNARPYNIYIKSPNVATVTNIFYGAVATYKKTLYIPYMNSDGTYTKTHNSFNAATYTNNATGNYYRYDISPYNSIADYWVTVTSPNLYLNTYRGQSATPTTVATSPFAGNTVYLLPSTYTANATLTYVDCNNVPFAGTTVLGAFKSCYTLQGVDNINVPSGVTTAQNMFYDCRELRSAHVNLPASCTTATTMFINCKNCTDIVLDAPGLTTMTNCFDACNSQPLNITLTSPNISTITNMFRRAVTTQRKNIYIYYKYSNGAFTTTYTKMNIAQYAGTSGLSNSASPKYNSTGNYYVYNLTAKYQDTNVANILAGFTYAQSGSTYNLTKYIGGAYAKVPKKEQVKLYPDSTSTTTYGVDTVIYNNCFNNTASLVSVDLRDVPFVSNSMYDAFYNCRNLISVYNINPNVTNMRSTFYSCFNLNQNIQIPSSVTNMSSTFESCHNFNQNIQIPNSVTNMYWAFSYCLNFSKNVTILSNQITSADNLFYGTTKAKNVYIPFKYSNGVKSATFNSFVTAGYLTAAGASTGQNGVTMHDLNA